MNADGPRTLLDSELRFFGRIVAGQSHEIMNVLNTLNELNGLQKDLLLDTSTDVGALLEKLEGIADRAHDQVLRGVAIVRSVNSFAHTTDTSVGVIDIEESLRRVTDLAQRQIRLTKATLDHAFPATSASCETRPFAFMAAVYTCIELALMTCSVQRHITVSYGQQPDGVEITVTSADPIGCGADVIEKEAVVAEIMRGLGGKIAASPGSGDVHRMVLFLPGAVPGTESDGIIKNVREEDTNAS